MPTAAEADRCSETRVIRATRATVVVLLSGRRATSQSRAASPGLSNRSTPAIRCTLTTLQQGGPLGTGAHAIASPLVTCHSLSEGTVAAVGTGGSAGTGGVAGARAPWRTTGGCPTKTSSFAMGGPWGPVRPPGAALVAPAAVKMSSTGGNCGVEARQQPQLHPLRNE